jgi:hypothetical protein
MPPPAQPLPALPNSGTIADTVEKMPALAPVRPTATPIEDRQPWGDWLTGGSFSGANLHAGRISARADRSDFDEIRIRDGYAPIVAALGLPETENPIAFYSLDPQAQARVGTLGQPSRLATAARQGESSPFGSTYMATRDLQERLIADQIHARRAKDPKFLPGVPDTVDGLHAYFLAEESKKRRAAEGVLEASPGLATSLSSFAGSAIETFHDPLNIATLPIGGGGKTLVGIAAREALVNGILELGQQPIVAANRAELGEHLTVGEALANSGTAAVGGAALGTGFHLGGRLVSKVAGNLDLANTLSYKIYAAMPERLQRQWGAAIVTKWAKRLEAGETLNDVFANLSNVELAALSRSVVGEGKLTPDEIAAGHVLTRAQEVGESSPFHAGPAGDGAHEQGLAAGIKDLEDRLTPQEPPARGPLTVESYVDDYIAGKGRGDPEMEQFGANNGPQIEAEFQRRAAAAGVGRPRVDVSTGPRPQQPGTAPVAGPAAIERFIAKTHHAENATGNVNARNPESSASGPWQFTDGTFRDYHKKVLGTDPGAHPSDAVKNDPATQKRLMDALTRDNAEHLASIGEAVNEGNLYLEHFLGRGDAARVFKAGADTPIERVLSADVLRRNSFLKGKSASETIAWAHAKMGGAVPSVGSRPGFASTLDAAGDDPAVAQLRAEAMQLDDAVIGITRMPDGSPVTLHATRVPASSILIDADRFQFKSGGDAAGVTDRLKGVNEWDPGLAGRVTLWQDNEGRLFAADGHQRVGLAKRVGADTPIDAMVLRERDGISAETARTWAALKNVAEGTGSAVDAAKVIRGGGGEALLKRLPPRSALVRDAGALYRLSDDAFGAVVNEVIPPDQAAVIGHLLPTGPKRTRRWSTCWSRPTPPTAARPRALSARASRQGFMWNIRTNCSAPARSRARLCSSARRCSRKGLPSSAKCGWCIARPPRTWTRSRRPDRASPPSKARRRPRPMTKRSKSSRASRSAAARSPTPSTTPPASSPAAASSPALQGVSPSASDSSTLESSGGMQDQETTLQAVSSLMELDAGAMLSKRARQYARNRQIKSSRAYSS